MRSGNPLCQVETEPAVIAPSFPPSDRPAKRCVTLRSFTSPATCSTVSSACGTSSVGGALVRNTDQTIDVYTTLDDAHFHERLKPQNDEQIASRLLGYNEATIITRGDQLSASGLPEQFPAQFDSVLVATRKLSGVDDVRWAEVPHPLQSLERTELRERAESATEQFLAIVLASGET